MICNIYGIQLLMIHDWEVVKVFDDPNLGNSKYAVCAMPGFHIDEFPFLVTNGRVSINLLNVKEKEMQVFIQAPCYAYRQAIHFQTEEYGFSMHFCSKKATETNSDRHTWYSMACK